MELYLPVLSNKNTGYDPNFRRLSTDTTKKLALKEPDMRGNSGKFQKP